MSGSPVGPGGGGLGRGGADPAELFSSRSYTVTKHSWKGKYRRVLLFGPDGACTLNPATMEATNRWPYEDLVSVQPMSAPQPSGGVGPGPGGPGAAPHPPGSPPGQPPLEFQLSFRKGGGRKTDSMKFSSEHRAQILTDALRHHGRFAENIFGTPKVRASKSVAEVIAFSCVSFRVETARSTAQRSKDGCHRSGLYICTFIIIVFSPLVMRYVPLLQSRENVKKLVQDN